MTLVLSENDVESFLVMREVVSALEDAFKHQAKGEAVNTPRTRSESGGGVLSVMHASLGYLGRSGAKLYMSSRGSTKFAVLLYDSRSSSLLAVMGAETLGRFRTGAASGLATKHAYHRKSATMSIFGSGGQALTQVTAVGSVLDLEEVRVWSPNREHREKFAARLKNEGFRASVHDSPKTAFSGAEIASAITSTHDPFIEKRMVADLEHLNICGSNLPTHSEVSTSAIGEFTTVIVDDLSQAKIEYGDLIQAAAEGSFDWENASELKDLVSGKLRPAGKTIFKSGGAAIEDVAAASLVYDKAVASGRFRETSVTG